MFLVLFLLYSWSCFVWNKKWFYILNLYFAVSCYIFNWHKSVLVILLVDSFWFSPQILMRSKNKDCCFFLTDLYAFYFYFFPYLSQVKHTIDMVKGTIVLLLEWEKHPISPLNVMMGLVFINTFSWPKKFSFTSSYLKVLIMNES